MGTLVTFALCYGLIPLHTAAGAHKLHGLWFLVHICGNDLKKRQKAKGMLVLPSAWLQGIKGE
jgi:hypothetical protein